MWKVVWKPTLGVFVAALFCGPLVAAYHHSTVNWKLTLIIAAMAAVGFAIRYSLLLRKTAKQFEGLRQVFHEATHELVDAMARLSPGDFSIYVSACNHPIDAPDQLIMTTARGSANHRVLVQMTDLGFARPHLMEQIGGGQFGLAQYALTLKGRRQLRMLVHAAAKRRQFLLGQQRAAGLT